MNALFGIILTVLIVRSKAFTDGDIRLAGINSNSQQGRVEIYKYNEWGTVCSRHFRVQEATVVCRQLGFPESSLNNSRPVATHVFGAGAGRILLDDISCFGYERRLLNCMFTYWNNDCTHNDDVGVSCSGTIVSTPYPPPVITTQPSGTAPAGTSTGLIYDYGRCNPQSPTIRLVRPANLRDEGVVQVYMNGQWGTVCDTNWDRLDAQVACRQLCYNANYAVPGSNNFDATGIPDAVSLTNFGCYGTEASLLQCPRSPWAYNVCGRHKAARVTCDQMTSRPSTIAPPALECDDGKITVNFTSNWEAFVPYSQMTLVWPSQGACGALRQDMGSYVTFSIPYNECGTQITTNATHIFYKNAILYVPNPTGLITRIKTYMIYVQCEFPRDYDVNQGIIPVTDSIGVSAPGRYTPIMYFYRDQFATKYTQYPVRIPIGDMLNVGIELVETTNLFVKLVVTGCYATPSVNRLDPVRYNLFSDKCIDDETVTFHHLTKLLSGFRYQTFKFVHYNNVYIHCHVFVCPENDTSTECDRTCHVNAVGKRRRRDTPLEPIYVRSNPISMEDPENIDHPQPTTPHTSQTESPVTKDHGINDAPTTRRPDVQPSTTPEPDTIIHITNGPSHNKPAHPNSKTVVFHDPTTLPPTNSTDDNKPRVTDVIENAETPTKQTSAPEVIQKPAVGISAPGEVIEAVVTSKPGEAIEAVVTSKQGEAIEAVVTSKPGEAIEAVVTSAPDEPMAAVVTSAPGEATEAVANSTSGRPAHVGMIERLVGSRATHSSIPLQSGILLCIACLYTAMTILVY